jgi:hypothetical protein
MMKRKLATVLAGTTVLGTLAFAPAAFAQDTVIVDRPVTPGTTTVVEPSDSSSVTVVEPGADSVRLATAPQAFESQIHYGYAVARQPGSVPSPYTDLPASGHIGDEFFFKHSGGVPGA